MKICRLCKQEKEYDKFPRHSSYKDGYYSRCKECNYALEKKWRQGNQEKKREIRTRYRESNREQIRTDDKKSYSNNKEKRCDYQKEYAKKNPKVKKSQIQLQQAVKQGIVKRKEFCQICGKTGKRLDGHHCDYERPLDVIWVCKSCHISIHKKILP